MGRKRRVDVVLTRASLGELEASPSGAGQTLFVPSKAALRAGEVVEVNLRFEGFPHEFVVPGVVTSVRSHGRGTSLPSGATLAVDAVHAPRIEKVLAFARGEKIKWAQRQYQRFVTHHPIVLRWEAGEASGETRDLSLGGAGLSVDGPLPGIGDAVEVRLEDVGGFRSLKLTAKVMWLDFFSGSRGMGVKFTGGGFGWKRKIEKLVDALRAAQPG